MPPIKILHIVASGGLYGKEQVILALMREHRHMEMESVLGSIRLPGEAPKDIEQVAQDEGLCVQPYVLQRGLDFKGARQIWKDALTRGIQIIHIHDYKGSILLGFQKWLRHMPPLMRTLHGFTTTTSFSKIALYEWLDRQSLRFHDALIGVSEDMKTKLSMPLHIIKNGISPVISSSLDEYPDIVEFCSRGVIWGSVARLSPEKNQLALLDALLLAVEHGMDAKLLLLGDGEERSRLESHIREKGLEQRVCMPGFLPDARRFLSKIHLYVQPSLREGTPISVLESMDAGIPLCITPVGAMESLLQRGAAWPLPWDAQGIAAQILALWHNPTQQDKIRSKARQIFAQEYASDVMAQAYKDTYIALLQTRTKHKT